MIANITINEKSFGDKSLFRDLSFSLQDGEKVGFIGRNGEGKTTLFRILMGEDTDFQGDIVLRRGAVLSATRQEHHGFESMLVLEYVLHDLPEYIELKHAMETLPASMGSNMKLIHEYSQVLETFEQKGYYTVEDEAMQILEKFQLDQFASSQLGNLSGGQKRLVEVAKIMLSKAHIALVDEPTNHMDFEAKQQFLQWMRNAKETVFVITHDRDVLHEVDRIIELRDQKVQIFNGNYDTYLAQNARGTSNQMNEYELVQRRISNLKAKVIEYQRFKEKARDPGTIQRFKRLEGNTREELATLQQQEKPTFWIDRDSVANMGLKVGEQYTKYKAKNIRLQGARTAEGHSRVLLNVTDLSLGYDAPLFEKLMFQVREGEVIELRGRNGAGKTTVINALLAAVNDKKPTAKVFSGVVESGKHVLVGLYEQEIAHDLFELRLYDAIERIYLSRNLSIGDTKIRQLMSDYLFTPGDMDTPVSRLSGGQKARLQLIAMLSNNPSLLILDEPTNHLDLPSIEELEQSLATYKGAILYVSHDTYFRRALGGEVVTVGAST